MAVSYPSWYKIQTGAIAALEKVAAEENAVDEARTFIVAREIGRAHV